MAILVTGGAGFIGSNFVNHYRCPNEETIISVDKLTYAGNSRKISDFKSDNRCFFKQTDIKDFQ